MDKVIHLRVHKKHNSELLKITHGSKEWKSLMIMIKSMGYSKVEVVGAVKEVRGLDKQEVIMEKASNNIIEEVLLAHTGSNVEVKTKDEQIAELKKELKESKQKWYKK